MYIGWTTGVHHFTICKHFCPIFCYLVQLRAYDLLHQDGALDPLQVASSIHIAVGACLSPADM